MDLNSGQNTENSNQTDTSNKLFNVARGPLVLAELVPKYLVVFMMDSLLLMLTFVLCYLLEACVFSVTRSF